MNKKRIKVVLVDDSLLILNIFKKILSSYEELEIVGAYSKASDALQAVIKEKPDVLCTDYSMPGMDGLELISEIMEKNPCPILVVSSLVEQKKQPENVFNLLEAGAVDVLSKPLINSEEELQKFTSQLLRKIILLSGVYTFRRKKKNNFSSTKEMGAFLSVNHNQKFNIVLIGASTGGPLLISEIIKTLPENYSLPIVCVQHISEGFLKGMIDWLQSLTKLKIETAGHGDFPKPGTIYFPPEKSHLLFDNKGRFLLDYSEPLNGHKPAINKTFYSAADTFGEKALALLLTGMGNDGATGLLQIRGKGGYTIAQDESSCVVFGMPKAAIEMDAVVSVFTPSEIIQFLKNL